MGKQHSDDRPARRGNDSRSNDSRGNDSRSGYQPRSGNGGGSNYKGSRPDGRGEGYSPARPTFGQGGGNKFGGRPSGNGGSFGKPAYGEKRSFGGDRPERGGTGEKRSFGGERNAGAFGEKRSFGGERTPGAFGEKRTPGAFGEKRSFGGDRGGAGKFGGDRGNSSYGEKRSYGGDRPERGSFGGDREARPRRFEQNEGGEPRSREDRGDRPAYPPKPIWQGQPVRYEGKPTVPRGTAGERNRKFIKRNPDGTPVEDTNARPAYTGRDERRSFEERGSRDERPRSEGNREDRPARREFTPRPGGDDRRGSFGDRRPASGDGGERRTYGSREGSDRPAGRERTEGAFGKPRSYGERPTNTGSGTFRERREAMRAAESGPRSSTGYGRADKPKFGEKPGEAPDYKNLKHYENDKTRGNKRRASEEDFGNEELRLNRYIANAGICSRREADSLIAAGEIRVNGEVITEMGYKVQPTDTVQYGKTNLNREKVVYVLLNKPKDFLTTTDDPEGRKTVMDLVRTASKERIFPVGRLDRNTTGLLLFTNDGEVAQKLSHPSHKNKKIYQAELDKPLTADHLAQIAAGLELEDGKAEVDDVAVVAGNPHFVGIELHVGRNRIVRRIFEHLGYDVVALDRVQYAGLTKKDLPRGKWRFLSEQEVIRLKYFM
ncbi:pseudouridine synthase [Hymenobacter cheonanensis]|uniref:pseudouridine synthase n=1 Tax=Hymenobacter sp. CA2-7 TaxID=3063993 RepID=UPI00271320E9|nr:pseudouridine synthase [Hymenobacter sp. CA2-7]MDO7884848.1 pseudouridine synthase [Hymenobacter sp. CA2-7]